MKITIKQKNKLYLLNTSSSLSRGLKEDETMLTSKVGSLLKADGTTVLEVTLVANQDDRHVAVGMCLGILC